jgi:hypothetical protein
MACLMGKRIRKRWYSFCKFREYINSKDKDLAEDSFIRAKLHTLSLTSSVHPSRQPIPLLILPPKFLLRPPHYQLRPILPLPLNRGNPIHQLNLLNRLMRIIHLLHLLFTQLYQTNVLCNTSIRVGSWNDGDAALDGPR